MHIEFKLPVYNWKDKTLILSGALIGTFFDTLKEGILYVVSSSWIVTVYLIRKDRELFIIVPSKFDENPMTWKITERDILFKYDRDSESLDGFQPLYLGGNDFNRYLKEMLNSIESSQYTIKD